MLNIRRGITSLGTNNKIIGNTIDMINNTNYDVGINLESTSSDSFAKANKTFNVLTDILDKGNNNSTAYLTIGEW